MNKIILIIFILFLINLFLFCLIISKINEILNYFKKYNLEHMHHDITSIQLDIKFLRKAFEIFDKLLVNIANHIYVYDEDENEVTLV